MMNIFGRIKNKINEVKSNRKYKALKKSNAGNEDTLFVDLGASSIKMSYQGELITFRSSVRKVIDRNEVTIQKNAIEVNGEWFIVGESTQATGNYEYKYQKEYLEVLMLFGLSMLKEKANTSSNTLKVNILLPYNQIHTKEKLSKIINGVYQVRTKNGIPNCEVSITLNEVFVEGETSKVYFGNKYGVSGNTCVVNIGYSTTDVTLYNSMNCREQITSLNIGTNNLLSQYLRFTKAPTSSILNTWLNDGYEFTKEEQRCISEVNTNYIKTLWNDIYNGVIKLSNPNNTNIVFCGGGSILLLDEFRESIPKKFNIKVLSNIECVYSDLLGMMMLSNEASNILENEVCNEVSITDEVSMEQVSITEVNEVSIEVCDEVPSKVSNEILEIVEKAEVKTSIPSKPRKKGSNFDKFVELKEKGFDNKEIMEQLNLALQTIRNYQSKYNKLTSNI